MSYYDVMSRGYDSPPGERRRRRRRGRGGLVVAILFVVVVALFVGLVIGGIRVLDSMFNPAADYTGPGTGSVEVQITGWPWPDALAE